MTPTTAAEVVRGVIAVETDASALIAYLETWLPRLEDDSAYWAILLAAWTMNGRRENQDRYRALFLADRRNRRRGMKHASRKVYDRLPDPVRVYRAAAPDEDASRALAWSLDPARLRKMYPGRAIVERVVPRSAIAFYTDRRGEREVIIPSIPA